MTAAHKYNFNQIHKPLFSALLYRDHSASTGHERAAPGLGDLTMTTVSLDCDYNAENCVRSLISVTEALNEIVGKENDAIADGRAEDIAPYQAEKARLAAAHARSIQTLAANRSAYCAVETSLLSSLRELTVTFEARVSEQYLLLNGASL